MDLKILTLLLEMYGIKEIPENIMPMSISKLGNNSVATIPILYDMINKGEMKGQQLFSGDNILFASVGAGVNINVLVYKVP
jgi:3-oxoacyl-[acyl-carrier-protein] synthase-3